MTTVTANPSGRRCEVLASAPVANGVGASKRPGERSPVLLLPRLANGFVAGRQGASSVNLVDVLHASVTAHPEQPHN